MVQTGISAPFGAAAPAAFSAQNGEVKPAEVKEVPLLPPPATVSAGVGAGPPFSPPPQPVAVTAGTTSAEQPAAVSIVSSPPRGMYLPTF